MKYTDCFFLRFNKLHHYSNSRQNNSKYKKKYNKKYCYYYYYYCRYFSSYYNSYYRCYSFLLFFLFFVCVLKSSVLCFDVSAVSTVSKCNKTSKGSFVRLNKLVSLKKKLSRRKSDQFIKEGNVKLNNKIVCNPGTHIDITKDRLVIENQPIKFDMLIKEKRKKCSQKKTTPNYLPKWIALHKPKGYICTSNDEKNRKHIFSLLSKNLLENYRLVFVGRLDRNTSGLLLLTNEYEWVHKLTHPKFERVRTYRVYIEGGANMQTLKRLASGIYLKEEKEEKKKKQKQIQTEKEKKRKIETEKEKEKEKEKEMKKNTNNLKDNGEKMEKGKKTLPAIIEILRKENISIKGHIKKTTVLNISIREGRNRQIRRMFDQIHQPVIKIKRIAFGNITLKNIPFPKQYRELNQKEIADLKTNRISDI